MADPTTDRLSDSFQIDRASRYAAPEFEDQSLPIIYGDLAVPSREKAGVYAPPKIDTAGGGVYCVAGHEIWGGVVLFDDDGRVEADNYTLELAQNFQGRGVIATAAFTTPPKGRVTAVCKGRKTAAGGLIENPAGIVHDLMASVWGFSEQDIDMQSLARAATSAKALGYRAGGIIHGRPCARRRPHRAFGRFPRTIRNRPVRSPENSHRRRRIFHSRTAKGIAPLRPIAHRSGDSARYRHQPGSGALCEELSRRALHQTRRWEHYPKQVLPKALWRQETSQKPAQARMGPARERGRHCSIAHRGALSRTHPHAHHRGWLPESARSRTGRLSWRSACPGCARRNSNPS